MCDECKELVSMIEKTRNMRGSYVAVELTVPGNNRGRLIGPDGKEMDRSGTPQLPFTEGTE